MYRQIIALCLLGLMCSCTGSRKNTDSLSPEPLLEDTLQTIADTLIIEEEPIEEELQLPVVVDESFADFFYNFALNEKLQRSRIKFPLPCYTDSRKDSIVRDEWIYDPFFSQLESYSILFDKGEDMDLEKSFASTSVQIEWVYLATERIKRYYFERIQGQWLLEAIDYAAISEKESEHEDFYDFYQRFATDSVFQAERVVSPLPFVTVDPDDEFQMLETTLELGQWFAFQPILPKEFLTNVNYGQRLDKNSRTRIIEMKGFENGFCNLLHFHRRGGKWRLVKFEDLGD